jgi:hypothetical protein
MDAFLKFMVGWTERERNQEERLEPWAKKARQAVCILALATLATPALASCAPRAITETLTPVIEATETQLPPAETPTLEPSPTPTELTSPELQRLASEIEAAGITNYVIENNSIYWIGDGAEKELRARVMGNEAELYLRNGETVRAPAERLSVNTREENLSVPISYDWETKPTEQISNIVVKDLERPLYQDQTGIWYEYVFSDTGEVWQLAEDIPLGMPETLADSFTLDFRGIEGTVDFDVLDYFMENLKAKLTTLYDATGWQRYLVGTIPIGTDEGSPFLTRQIAMGPRFNIGTWVKLITGEGKEMYMLNISGDKEWYPDNEKEPDTARFMFNFLLYPEAAEKMETEVAEINHEPAYLRHYEK